MDWIGLADDRDRWRALVNAVRIFGFRNIRRISRPPENLLPSKEGLCSTELVS
jgi:hypothetical protein